MADIKSTATSVQVKKTSNTISWLAPLLCIIVGYIIWRFVIGADSNFSEPDKSGGFWPKSRNLRGRKSIGANIANPKMDGRGPVRFNRSGGRGSGKPPSGQRRFQRFEGYDGR